jgi:DNA-binding NarL/FixJ family response regulator
VTPTWNAPASADPARVLLVDDHTLFRAGVRTLIERDLGARITAECETGAQAMAAMALEEPDVAMLDISLRGEDGIDLAQRIVEAFDGRVRCIMLSMHLSADYVVRAFAAGALGYVAKDAGPAELTGAIQAVRAGHRYISPSASGALVDSLGRMDAAAPHHSLSPRQLEVLCLVARGMSTKLIARKLELSTKTVDAHRYQISQRLGEHDVAGMVRYAIRHGLVPHDT